MNEDFWKKESHWLCARWEEILIYDAGMESIISRCERIPIQNLKRFLFTKLSKKRMVFVFLEFFDDYSGTFKGWEEDLKKKYGSNYVELPIYKNMPHRLIYLSGGGALISPRRHAKKGTAYLYHP